jgi:hypothetical protein
MPAPQLEMAVVVSFSEIFDRPATIEGAREILAQYKRDSVLLVLAKLGAALRIWYRPDYERDNGLARDIFKNAARAEAHSMAGGLEASPPVLHAAWGASDGAAGSERL